MMLILFDNECFTAPLNMAELHPGWAKVPFFDQSVHCCQ
jgi:hypothetical protein